MSHPMLHEVGLPGKGGRWEDLPNHRPHGRVKPAMKADTHPTYPPAAKVACACGSTFTTGSTMEEMHVEICSACHPYFTGKQKLLDSAGRVDRFKKRAERTQVAAKKRTSRATTAAPAA